MSGSFCFEENRAPTGLLMQSAPEKEQKMKYDLIETGKRIKAVRKQHELTQEQFAEKFNVSVEHVGRIETGKRGISIDLLVDIACAFDVSLDYLILGIDRK